PNYAVLKRQWVWPNHVIEYVSRSSNPFSFVESISTNAKKQNLKHVELVQIHTEGHAPQVCCFFKNQKICVSLDYRAHFRDNSLSIGSNFRNAVNHGEADFIYIFLSEIVCLFQSPVYKLDMALLQVSPPDMHGFCSLGTVSIAPDRQFCGKTRDWIGEQECSETYGGGYVHLSHFAKVCNNSQLKQTNKNKTNNKQKTESNKQKKI
ncbi:hypothetical protein RFI_08749, partial [Reticulomyxa filosa]